MQGESADNRIIRANGCPHWRCLWIDQSRQPTHSRQGMGIAKEKGSPYPALPVMTLFCLRLLQSWVSRNGDHQITNRIVVKPIPQLNIVLSWSAILCVQLNVESICHHCNGSKSSDDRFVKTENTGQRKWSRIPPVLILPNTPSGL